MPIDKVNTQGVASLAKFWGVNVSDITKIIGIPMPVTVGDEISAGTPVVFESAVIQGTAVCSMDSTHAIVVYADGGNNYYGTAVCLSLSGTTITAGTPVVFKSDYAFFLSICTMSSTHAILTYQDFSGGTGEAVCLTLSGTTITVNTAVTVENAPSVYFTVCSMDSTHAITSWQLNNDDTKAVCLTLSGTTITVGTEVVVTSVVVAVHSICSMSSTHAILCYKNGGANTSPYAVCLTLSGSTITAYTPVRMSMGSVGGYVDVCSMSSTRALAVYDNGSSSREGFVTCISLSGTTITAATRVVFTSAAVRSPIVRSVSATVAVVSYEDDDTSDSGRACYLTLSGTAVVPSTPVEYDTGPVQYVGLCTMDSTHLISTYAGTSDYGTACCLELVPL